MIQANMGDHWTVLFITGIAQFSGIIAIWKPITARRLEDTLFGAIGTRPSIRILKSWELRVTLALAERFSHVFVILTQGLNLRAASKVPWDVASVVA